MVENEIQNTVQDVFREVFGDPSLLIEPSTLVSEIENWDSFNHMSLLLSLEERFRFKFSPQDVQPFQEVGQLMSLIENKVKGTSNAR